ncbi:MAG: D-Ala-D-Ala carboxypeptidase family metallohydrolase [Cyclobacteriaceae bacterium]
MLPIISTQAIENTKRNVAVRINKHFATGIYLMLGAGSFLLSLIIIKRLRKTTIMKDIDYSDFDSPDIPGSGKCMNKELIAMLVELEKKSGYPLFDNINSGARSEAHNKLTGGVKNSAHKIPVCRAVDIGIPNHTIRDRLVKEAVKIGFKRIGIANTFIHLDNDPSKPQNVAWGYPKAPYNPFT